MPTTITDEDRARAFNSVPTIVKDALSEGAVFDFFDRLRSTYQIHVDVVNTIVGLTRDLVLGLLSPAAFYTELLSAGLGPEVAKRVIEDLNTSVFIPLRTRMQEEPLQYAPEENPPSFSSQPLQKNTAPLPPAPLLASVPAYAPPTPASVYQPPVYVAPASAAPIPPAQAQAPVVQMPAETPSMAQVPPRPSQQGSVSSENRDELHKVMKEYGIDPYREPPE